MIRSCKRLNQYIVRLRHECSAAESEAELLDFLMRRTVPYIKLRQFLTLNPDFRTDHFIERLRTVKWLAEEAVEQVVISRTMDRILRGLPLAEC